MRFFYDTLFYPQMMTTHVPLIRSRGESYPPKHLSERGYRNIQNIFTLNVELFHLANKVIIHTLSKVLIIITGLSEILNMYIMDYCLYLEDWLLSCIQKLLKNIFRNDNTFCQGILLDFKKVVLWELLPLIEVIPR